MQSAPIDFPGNYLDGEVGGRINILVDNYQKHLGSVKKDVKRQHYDQTREQDRVNRENQELLAGFAEKLP